MRTGSGRAHQNLRALLGERLEPPCLLLGDVPNLSPCHQIGQGDLTQEGANLIGQTAEITSATLISATARFSR